MPVEISVIAPLHNEEKKEEPLAQENQIEQENKQQVEGQQEEVEIVAEENRIGLYPELINRLYNSWKSNEKEYARNMIYVFKSISKQNNNIETGLDEIKRNFKDFLNRPDIKQDKLDHFIESFNKFTEEFPELRPDDQTKEELNNR